MATEYLLLKDVESLGRSGDIVRVKPGYARNYLVPKQKAIFADKNTIRMQQRLQEERAKQAANDRKESEALASHLEGVVLSIPVKVDPEGHMYGSVSAQDLVALLQDKGFEIDKRFIRLEHPIKAIGHHVVPLKLKEGVEASIKAKVFPEGNPEAIDAPKAKEEAKPEAQASEEQEETNDESAE